MKKSEYTAGDLLLDNGYEDVVIFSDYSYDDALIGVSHDNRAIYDYEKMVEWLMKKEGWSEEEAVEWIDYNTLGAIPSGIDSRYPIVMYGLHRFPEEANENEESL